jgi:hypothetical protein
MNRREEFATGNGTYRGLTKPDYTKHYNRGWGATSEMALENADNRGEHPAWYDGYTDNAVGRSKFHSRDCPKGPVADHGTCG